MAQTDSNPDKPLKTALRRPAAAAGAAAASPPAATLDGPVIGFNELRQACEISALREDLARLSDDAEALCGHIEDGVEQVRRRVAGLCAEELADPDVMAPLLQFAVGTLISIRDRARDIDLRFGAPDDAERPDWTAAAPPKSPSAKTSPVNPLFPTPASPAPPPAPHPPPPLAKPAPAAATAMRAPPPPLAVSPPPVSPPSPQAVSPLAPLAGATHPPPPLTPTRPGAVAVRPTPAPSAPSRRVADGPVDWLGPARK